MTYDAFLEQMKKDLEFDFATGLPDKYSGVKIGIRDVEKLQGESYRCISFKDVKFFKKPFSLHSILRCSVKDVDFFATLI